MEQRRALQQADQKLRDRLTVYASQTKDPNMMDWLLRANCGSSMRDYVSWVSETLESENLPRWQQGAVVPVCSLFGNRIQARLAQWIAEGADSKELQTLQLFVASLKRFDQKRPPQQQGLERVLGTNMMNRLRHVVANVSAARHVVTRPAERMSSGMVSFVTRTSSDGLSAKSLTGLSPSKAAGSSTDSGRASQHSPHGSPQHSPHGSPHSNLQTVSLLTKLAKNDRKRKRCALILSSTLLICLSAAPTSPDPALAPAPNLPVRSK